MRMASEIARIFWNLVKLLIYYLLSYFKHYTIVRMCRVLKVILFVIVHGMISKYVEY